MHRFGYVAKRRQSPELSKGRATEIGAATDKPAAEPAAKGEGKSNGSGIGVEQPDDETGGSAEPEGWL